MFNRGPMIKFLVQRGGTTKTKNVDRQTPMKIAKQRKNKEAKKAIRLAEKKNFHRPIVSPKSNPNRDYQLHLYDWLQERSERLLRRFHEVEDPTTRRIRPKDLKEILHDEGFTQISVEDLNELILRHETNPNEIDYQTFLSGKFFVPKAFLLSTFVQTKGKTKKKKKKTKKSKKQNYIPIAVQDEGPRMGQGRPAMTFVPKHQFITDPTRFSRDRPPKDFLEDDSIFYLEKTPPSYVHIHNAGRSTPSPSPFLFVSIFSTPRRSAHAARRVSLRRPGRHSRQILPNSADGRRGDRRVGNGGISPRMRVKRRKFSTTTTIDGRFSGRTFIWKINSNGRRCITRRTPDKSTSFARWSQPERKFITSRSLQRRRSVERSRVHRWTSFSSFSIAERTFDTRILQDEIFWIWPLIFLRHKFSTWFVRLTRPNRRKNNVVPHQKRRRKKPKHRIWFVFFRFEGRVTVEVFSASDPVETGEIRRSVASTRFALESRTKTRRVERNV